MYENFDHMRIKVVQTPTLFGPFNNVHEDSATYNRVLNEADIVCKKMADSSNIMWEYFESIGINPQDSFTDALDDKIFEYLLRIALKQYGEELIHVVFEDNGMCDLDEVTFFIK